MTRLRILHFLPWITRGGVEVSYRDLIEGMGHERWEHQVACIEADGPRIEEYRARGIPVKVLGGRASVRNLPALARLVALARATRPHVVHAGVFEGQVFGTVAARLAGVPVVVTEETTVPGDVAARSALTRALLRRLLRWNDRVVAIAVPVAEYLVETNHLPPEQVVVIRRGVRPPRLPSQDEVRKLRESLGWPDGVPVVGIVCRLFDFVKRVSDLVRACGLLTRAGLDLRLLVVGEGPDRARLESLARQELAGRHHFAGYDADPSVWYALMDVFAHPSAYEGFGKVFPEAGLAGLPCVGTRVGGIVDAVEDGVTGLLVPPRDPEALADAIGALLRDPELRRRMGEAGRRRAQELCSIEGSARAYSELFERLLEQKGVRA